jgi:hypothetical protein
MMNKILMLFTALLAAVNANNMLNYIDYDPNIHTVDRCTLLIEKRRVFSFDLDDDKTKLFQYDERLGVIKILTNTNLSVILFGKGGGFFQGIYYTGYGNTGPVEGRCVFTPTSPHLRRVTQ